MKQYLKPLCAITALVSIYMPNYGRRNIFTYDDELTHTPHCVLAHGCIEGYPAFSLARTDHGMIVGKKHTDALR
jgi:hypothetical protein